MASSTAMASASGSTAREIEMINSISTTASSDSDITSGNATVDGSSGADAIEAPVATATTVAPKRMTINNADTCAWYTGTRCYMPRQCYDCINTAIRRDSCAVDPNGVCVSMVSYRQYANRVGSPDDPNFLGFFPAANFTYCSSADDTCQQCKEQWRQSYHDTGVVPKGESCYGANGCVCIAACEMPNRDSTIINSQCSTFGAAGERSKLVTTVYVGVGVFGMVLLGALVFKAWLRKRRDLARAQARRERRERRLNRVLRTGPALALTGWNELREKLLETEKEFIEGGGKPSLAQPGLKEPEAAAVVAAGDEVGGDQVAYVQGLEGDDSDNNSDYLSPSDGEDGTRERG